MLPLLGRTAPAMRMLLAGGKIARALSPPPAAGRRALSLLLALTASGLASCGSFSLNDVPAANVASDQYQGLTCDRIKSEAQKLNARKTDLAPALFPSISEQERENQLAQINGELNALSRVSADQCGTRR